MTINKARLLIRVASQIPDSEDRKTLLAWADEILANTPEEISAVNSNQLRLPILISRSYKGKFYQAQLFKGGRVQLNGKDYNSPSAAAYHVSGHNENGWRIWHYEDESTGKKQPISNLRGKI